MPDETTRTEATSPAGIALTTVGIGVANMQIANLQSRIAALEAEREEIERALEATFTTAWDVDAFMSTNPTALAALLAWHRARGAQEGRADE